jgi:transcriptional regulator with XRE-family HTH domain
MSVTTARPGAARTARHALGDLLRHWRRVRRFSQLDLATAARSTPRYISFVETGRARPSREMVMRLARALDVPLRERNSLLLAAGYAPAYPVEPLDSPALERIDTAISAMLDQHSPYPAVVLDRGWNVRRVNDGAFRLFSRLYAPDPFPDRGNALRMMIEPGPLRRSMLNWDTVAPSLFARARREAVGGVLDADTAELVHQLENRPDVATLLDPPDPVGSAGPVLDVRFAVCGRVINLFSVVSIIGTPTDVTAQELRVESFFPSDEQTRAAWAQI